MDFKLQRDIVTYLLQHPNARVFFQDLPTSAFDSSELVVSTQIIQAYLKQYGVMPPNKDSVIAFTLEQEGGRESIEQLESTIDKLYDPTILTSEELAHGKAVELLKQKQLLDLLRSSAPRLLSTDGVPLDLDAFYSQTRRIIDFSPLGEAEQIAFSIREDIAYKDKAKVFQTHLQGLNNLTNAKGFHRPQLIVIMAAPKGFKTGTLIALGIGMVLVSDAKIAYFDYENGGESIHTRAMKALLNCTEAELLNASQVNIGGDRTLEQLKYSMRQDIIRAGSDFIAFEMSQKTTTREAEVRLIEQKEKTGFVPDGAFWDYADLMSPTSFLEKQNRFSIQGVYKDIVNFNKSHDTFSFTQSQVNRAAISKEVIEMEDFSEDIGKAHNAHAAFALCRSDDEVKAGLGRLVPVMQREGKRFDGENHVTLEIFEDRQEVTEVFPNLEDDYMNFGDN